MLFEVLLLFCVVVVVGRMRIVSSSNDIEVGSSTFCSSNAFSSCINIFILTSSVIIISFSATTVYERECTPRNTDEVAPLPILGPTFTMYSFRELSKWSNESDSEKRTRLVDFEEE